MRTRSVTFPNAAGQQLAGRLDLPLVAPAGFAIFAHCFTCGKNLKSRDSTSAMRSTPRASRAALRLHRARRIEGRVRRTGFAANVDDLVAAAAYLRGHRAPSLLVGHSLGGAAVLHAAARIDR
jgi:putative redox protein